MTKWLLGISLETRWEALRPALGLFVQAALVQSTQGQSTQGQSMIGTSEWTLEHRTPTRDKNGTGETFAAQWNCGNARLDETVRNGSGDPREGWGYELSMILTAPHLKVTLHSSAWTQSNSSVQVTLEGSADAFLALRNALSPLGKDTTDQPYLAITNVQAAQESPDLVRALVTAALAYGPPGCAGWRELLTLHESFAGPNLERRLQESPEDADAWRAAAHLPDEQRPSGLSAQRCMARAHRLAPETAEVADVAYIEQIRTVWTAHPLWPGRSLPASLRGWHALDPGPSGGGFFPALVFQAIRALFPEAPPVERSGLYLKTPYPQGDAHVTGEVWARYTNMGLALVCRREYRTWSAAWKKAAPRARTGMNPERQAIFTWIWDDEGDHQGLLLFVEHGAKNAEGDYVPQGVQATWAGSPAFLERVKAALKQATPHPWQALE